MKTETVCQVLILPRETRSILIQVLIENGYTTKDIAELMEVSMPAASRYIHGTLMPSLEATCKALSRLAQNDPETYAKLVTNIARELWKQLRTLIEKHSRDLEHLAEEIADELAILLYNIHENRKTR